MVCNWIALPLYVYMIVDIIRHSFPSLENLLEGAATFLSTEDNRGKRTRKESKNAIKRLECVTNGNREHQK